MSICELGQLWVQPKGFGSWNVFSELTISVLKNPAQTSQHIHFYFMYISSKYVHMQEKISFLQQNIDCSSFNWVPMNHFLNIGVEELERAKKTW